MLELFENLSLGLSVAVSPINLVYCFVGVLIGTLIGVLPGVGPLTTVAMLLPFTYYLEPSAALIMLAGIYYGAQYGGSTTAILVNMPGESSSVMTCLDGYQMARNGRAGPALATAALSSFFAGCVATVLIALFAAPLAKVALLFGPAEYCALMALGLIASIVIAHGSFLKALGMIILGLLLSTVGTDVNSGASRNTFGFLELSNGIGFVAIAIGVFAVAELIRNLESPQERTILSGAVNNLWPGKEDVKRAFPATLRGTMLGSLLGVLPGGGATLSSYAAYALEKKVSKNGHLFGSGAIEGVAAPESANNAGAQTSFIPLLTLGIPGNPLIAVMAGAMMIQGIQPGPQAINQHPALFYGLICSMWIGNALLVFINLPLIGVWVQFLKIPYRLFAPVLLVLACVGVYSLNNSAFDVWLLVIFSLLGYAFFKWGCETAPLILAFVLGPLIEENFRRAMLLSRGELSIFIDNPISAGILGLCVVLVAFTLLPSVRRVREVAFTEES